MHSQIDLDELAQQLAGLSLSDAEKVHIATKARPHLGAVAPQCPDWCSSRYAGGGCWRVSLAALDPGAVFHLQAIHRSRPIANGASAVEMVTIWRPGDPEETIIRRGIQIGGPRGEEDALGAKAARAAAQELLAAASLLDDLGGWMSTRNPYDALEDRA